MSYPKHYIISLEVSAQDGYLRSFDFQVTPTGTFATDPAGFLMQLLSNLTNGLTTLGDVEVVSSRVGRPRGLVD